MLVHQSAFLQSNAVVVRGDGGVLLVDAGLQDDELACLAGDLSAAGSVVVAGFSTHPDWDHLLWDGRLGDVPRYGTARCAAAVAELLSDPDIKARVTEHLEPAGIADRVSLDLFGLITGLPPGAESVPWGGPAVRILEHRAHAPGHAALFVEESGVLLAGDMLSDVLIPMLDLDGTADPIEDYLAALRLLESMADGAHVVVPGHGSVGAPGRYVRGSRWTGPTCLPFGTARLPMTRGSGRRPRLAGSGSAVFTTGRPGGSPAVNRAG
ncbi:MBL fold metallo-hydrolase [Paractinoplanes durhamensis]|uniref:MBL fold metallo-hydrolase n=1 Tax=Paractinoplanes durhamensis TaxID=113563 RepID=UPI003641D12C